MRPSAETSPPASAISIGAFDAGTWRKDELIAIAKSLSITTNGTKADIADRIRITLIQRSITPAVEVHTGVSTPAVGGSRNGRPDGFGGGPQDGAQNGSQHASHGGPQDRAQDNSQGASSPRGVIAPALRREREAAKAGPSVDFFRETPGESRAKGLAAWFARRTGSQLQR